MQDADQGEASDLDGHDLVISIVRAPLNHAITSHITEIWRSQLLALGVAPRHITVVTVPGALEVPIALKAMADQDDYDALVAIGCVIRGETYHFELVANESGAGVTRVSLDHQVPIANAILTVENEA